MAGHDRWPLATRRLQLLILAGCIILPLVPGAAAWLWWLGYNLLVLLLVGLDWARSPGARQVTLSVRVKGHWVRGERQTVGLAVSNEARLPIALDLRQDLPSGLGGPASVVHLAVDAGGWAEGAFAVLPQERGDYRLGLLHGRWPSRMGLLLKRGLWPCESAVRVYAPLRIDEGPAVAGPIVRDPQGSALVRAGGVYTEFESLREYRQGDQFRTVNWRASARRGHLVVNQYQAERTQQVMLVLDAGRLMVPEYRSIPRFEYALSAALQLGRVAAAHEDRVGLMIFGGTVDLHLPPGRGQAQIARLAEAAYRVKPQVVEPDYVGALSRLAASLRRRSLILIFTDFVAEGASERLVQQIAQLVPRHLVAVLAISDPAMLDLVGGEATTIAHAYAQAAGDWALEERSAARAALTRRGIPVMDVAPLALSSAAVSKYLAVKRQGLL